MVFKLYSSIDSLTIENGVGEIVVKSNFEKILKASDVSQLPYIQGMTDSVRNLEKTRSNDVMLAQFVLDEQVLAVSEYIGEVQEENAIFKVSFDVSQKDLSDATLEVFEIDEFIPAKYFLPETSEKLYTDGLSELQDNVESTKNALAVAYPDVYLKNGLSLDKLKSSNVKSITYDRIAARDYANTYTSECGSGYDTSYWNTDYVWHTENGGVDCANYVSQAIHAGGIPTDSTWKPESIAWVNTGRYNSSGLTHYMVNSGYFKKVTRNTCAAGGFISHTDFSHVIFVVANDTVTMQFSSHTADRKQASFAGSYYKNFDYYYINSAYQNNI